VLVVDAGAAMISEVITYRRIPEIVTNFRASAVLTSGR